MHCSQFSSVSASVSLSIAAAPRKIVVALSPVSGKFRSGSEN